MTKEAIKKELLHHTPFTLLATTIAIILITILSNTTTIKYSEHTFEIFHYLHIFVSGIATSAIYYKYNKTITKAIIIGILGTIIIGTFSDILLPYLGAIIFNFSPELHIPLLTTPLLVITIALAGSIFGIILKKSELPHSLHVLLSVFASIFYLITYANTPNTIALIISIIIVTITVVIPCCLSDIIFPLIFTKDYKHKH
jgi:hypothetical protein